MPASRTEAFAENGRRSLTLIFTGDLMQHMPQVFAARQRDGSFDYTSCFSRLNNYFSSADFVMPIWRRRSERSLIPVIPVSDRPRRWPARCAVPG